VLNDIDWGACLSGDPPCTVEEVVAACVEEAITFQPDNCADVAQVEELCRNQLSSTAPACQFCLLNGTLGNCIPCALRLQFHLVSSGACDAFAVDECLVPCNVEPPGLVWTGHDRAGVASAPHNVTALCKGDAASLKGCDPDAALAVCEEVAFTDDCVNCWSIGGGDAASCTACVAALEEAMVPTACEEYELLSCVVP
jgi:hypothetical protein